VISYHVAVGDDKISTNGLSVFFPGVTDSYSITRKSYFTAYLEYMYSWILFLDEYNAIRVPDIEFGSSSLTSLTTKNIKGQVIEIDSNNQISDEIMIKGIKAKRNIEEEEAKKSKSKKKKSHEIKIKESQKKPNQNQRKPRKPNQNQRKLNPRNQNQRKQKQHPKNQNQRKQKQHPRNQKKVKHHQNQRKQNHQIQLQDLIIH